MRILICTGEIAIGALLSSVLERVGYETVVLETAPGDAPPTGDLLLVDPTAAHATAWAQALRRLEPALPVVAVGLDPDDPGSLGFEPNAVLSKPFALDDLRNAVERGLHPH